MSHDAATGYINTNIVSDVVYNWVITQKGNFTDQLNCGARALDIRPKFDTKLSQLYFNHGPIEIKTPFMIAINDVIEWHAEHKETIILYISHCDGNGCIDETIKQLSSLKILVDSTIHLGSISVFINSIEENFDESTTCYDGLSSCWANDKQYNKLLSSLDNYASKSYSGLWMLQAHWQYTTSSVASGVVHLSSILKDESKSQLNYRILTEFKNGRWPNLSIIELDNICGVGSSLPLRKEILE